MKHAKLPTARSATRREQAGVMLLEALLSILIFSVGVLAIIGLQVTSVKQASDSKYRSDASLLANQLIGQMWTGNRNAATLQTDFQTGGTAYTTWLADVTNSSTGLPGAAANPPTVDVVINPATNSSQVTVTLSWRAPYEATAVIHNYTVVAQIK
jgi:type IV pilus assembly protein PilV